MDIVRRIKAILTADASQFDREVKGAAKSVESLGDASRQSERLFSQAWGVNSGKKGALTQLSSSIRENGAAWDEVSNKSLIAGGAIAAGLGLATKAAIDWESAFAGVRKTVDDTEEGYAALEQELRDLATVLPATQEEIAGVAEAAGQLGVQRENITEFTRVMIDLGETTNLSAEEAATGLARFANVMGTSLGDVDRLGSVIVGLGNNFATTEREILDMSSRLSGAGRQANLTEGDVLGIATALSSVGIEAEAGGTAFSRVMIEIGQSVDLGTESLDTFARVAGLTAEEFQALWQQDAGEGLQRFIAGLGDLQARGESLEPVLAELGFTDIRVGDALRRSAASSDVFTRALAQGNEEWEKNNALTEEAAKRYETAEAQLQIARNQIKDAAIDAGTVLAPILVDIAGLIADAASAFADLPKPIQEGAVWLAALGSAGLLAFGGTVKAVKGATELHDAMTQLAKSSPGAASGLGKVAKAGQGALVLAGVAVAIDQLSDSLARKGVAEVNDLADALDRFADGAGRIPELGDLFENQNTISWLPWRKEIQTTEEVLEAFAGQAERALAGSWTDRLERFLGNSSLERFQEQTRQLDAELAAMVEGGNLDGAVAAFEMFTEAAVAQGVPLESLIELFPQLAAAREAAVGDGTAAAIERTNAAIEQQATVTEEAAAAFEEWKNAVAESDASFIGILGAYDQVIAKNREVAEASAEATESAEDSWEDFYDGQTVSIEDYLAELESMVEAQLAWETNMLLLSGRVSQGVLDELARLGPEGAPLVADLVNASDEELARLEAVYEQRGKNATDAFAETLRLASPVLAAIMQSAGTEAADEAARALASGEATIQDVIDQYDLDFIVDAETGAAKRSIDRFVMQNNGRTVTVRVVANVPGSLSRTLTGGLVQADGGVLTKSRGGLVQAFASGGMFDGSFAGAQPQIRPYAGPRGVLWGEEGSGPWEAFISGHPQKLPRSRSVADEVVARLGGRIEWVAAYANGGIRETASVSNYYQGGAGSRSEDHSRHVNLYGDVVAYDVADFERRSHSRAAYNNTAMGPG